MYLSMHELNEFWCLLSFLLFSQANAIKTRNGDAMILGGRRTRNGSGPNWNSILNHCGDVVVVVVVVVLFPLGILIHTHAHTLPLFFTLLSSNARM